MKTPIKTVANGRELTDGQKKIMSIYYQSGGKISPKQAAEVAGIPEGSRYTMLKNMRSELAELAELMLIESAPRAACTVTELMTSEELVPQANIKLEAAKTLLDRAGVSKKEKLEIESSGVGNLFFIPNKKELSSDIIEGVYSDA